jgi:hypothetical protein
MAPIPADTRDGLPRGERFSERGGFRRISIVRAEA